MAEKKDKLSIYFLICFIILFILGARKSIMQQTQEQDLMSSFEITNGQLMDCGVSKHADFGRYSFIVNDEVFNTSFQVDKFCLTITQPFCDDLKKYKFPVAYNPNNPKLNTMILSENDHRKYKVPRLDSLKRVYERYFDCR